MKRILSIEISKSNFYRDPIKLEFSEKLNCIMGGRGTGKSTLLHFLDSGLSLDAEEDKTTYNILKNNLGPGLITINIQDEEGKKYRIVKTIDENPQSYSIPGEKFVPFKSIFSTINCDFYKSQSIEEIGKNPTDRLELIDKMLLAEKMSIQDEIEEIQMNLEENAQTIKSENSRIKQFNQNLQQYENIEGELKKWQEEKPDDLDKKEQKEFEAADKNEKIRASEKRHVKSINNKLEEIQTNLEEHIEDIKTSSTLTSKTDAFINKLTLNPINEEFNKAIQKVSELFEESLKTIERALQKIEDQGKKLEKEHSTQQNEFVRLKQKIDKHKSFYTKWNALTKKEDEKKAILENKKKVEEKRIKIKRNRTDLLKKLIDKNKQLFELRKSKIEQINSQFDGSVKITLTYGGITDEFEDSLRNALKGSSMRYNTLIPSIVQNFPPHRFAEIIHSKDHESLKKIAGIDKERSTALINALNETDALYQIEMICCPDLPEFLLKVDEKENPLAKGKGNYKKSDDLSTGQRCTTVLPIVFAISENPLIIDQPEDNLDNKYISDTIHKIIREQKNKRQLIFITHNPNIPVLSDADSNFFLNYDNKKSNVDCKGSIYDVKTHILTLMEGGKDAFKKREKLYKEELNEQ